MASGLDKVTCNVYIHVMTKETLINALMQEVAGQCTCQKLREATRKISRRYDEALKPAGIKGSQFTMLAVISRSGVNTMTDLADILGMERTTLIRNLKPLARDGLVEVSAEGYRRSRSAGITDKGIAVLETAVPIWRATQLKLKGELGIEAWDQVHTGLGALNQLH